MSIGKHIILIITFSLTLCQNLYSNNPEDSFLINKTETWIIIDGLKNNIDLSISNEMLNYKRIGYILDLHFDNNTQTFYHRSKQNVRLEFSELCDTLISRIKHDQKRYSIIFNIDENGISEFNKQITSLKKKIQLNTTRNYNHSLFDILKSDNLIFFSISNNESLDNSIQFFHEYFDIHNLSEPNKKHLFTPTKAQASMIYGIFDETQKNTTQSINTQRYFWQNKFLEDWSKTGLQPIFLVTESQTKYAKQLTIIADSPNTTNSTKGKITLNGLPLESFYWSDEKPTFSHGYFNYPIIDTKVFKPYKAGYEFFPNEITIHQNQKNSVLNFKAKPLNLSKNLKLQLLFNDTLVKDNVTNSKLKVKNSHIVLDKYRGSVLKINDNGYVSLGTSVENDIRGNNFSIAFWYKPEKDTISRYTVLGTNSRTVRQGLNIQLINDVPHFGFFINDLKSSHSINPMKWHHLAFTYDNVVKEKRIFINGQLKDIQHESLSFIGNDTIFLGQCIERKTKGSFYIDNFVLWNRTINEEEIHSLLSENSMFISDTTTNTNNYYWLLIIPGLVLLLITTFFLRKKAIPFKENKNFLDSGTQKNAIHLYGDLSIINKYGDNITPKFSPLLKELFIKLLTSYLEGESGNSSEKLNELFWNDLPRAKSRNRRNVAFVRLRKFLSNIPGIKIEYLNNKHSLFIDDSLFIDCKIANEHNALLNKQDILIYFNIVKRGLFLKDSDFYWLEQLKETYNAKTITQLLNILKNSDALIDDKLKEDICLYLLTMDDLNEEALKHLLNLYKKQGKSNLMSQFFNEFTTMFQKVYASEFKYTISEFLASEEK